MLKDLVPLIQRLTEGHALTSAEAELAFSTLEAEDEQSYYFFVFLAALHTKGETSEELLGFCKANERFVPGFDVAFSPDKIVDMSGTGGDRLKTLNVSTLAAFIVASQGATVVKQAFLGVTGLTGSADLLQAFGIDPLGISRKGPEPIRRTLQQMGMVIYHANSMSNPQERQGYFNFWLKRVPETGLAFVTAYHLAANIYSPIHMRRRVYGVFSEQYLEPLAKVFQRLGYTKGLVLHGLDGLDELSNVGPTRITEYNENSIRSYTVTPKELGVKRAHPNSIRAISREGNILDFVRVVYGIDKGAKRDLAVINAAAAFYVLDEVPSIQEGVELAGKLIDSEKVASKLESYVAYCGDIAKLNKLKSDANIKQ